MQVSIGLKFSQIHGSSLALSFFISFGDAVAAGPDQSQSLFVERE
jgi:hypothetical protein